MQRLTHKTSSSKCPIRFPIGFGSAVLCACLATACSEYKDPDDTFMGEAGALTGMPPVGDGDWSCLGELPNPPPLPGDPGARVLYGLQLVDLATGMPFPDVTVKACPLVDPLCKTPVAGPMQANEDGIVDVPLTENFVGYLEIMSPTAVPYIFHLPDDGLTTDRDFPLAMISVNSYMGLTQALAVPIDPALGGIAVRAFDCDGRRAEGVVLKSHDAGGRVWYFEGSVPTLARQYTDVGGLGGFVNAEPGFTNFEATLSNGDQITIKRILVRTGWMTAGYMRPRVAD